MIAVILSTKLLPILKMNYDGVVGMTNDYVISQLEDVRDKAKWLFDKQPLDPNAMEHLGKAHAHMCRAIEIEQQGG